ncbi:MAG: hypothetical protein WAW96_21580, partial [Alphaproteobacteria bacterium]
AGDIPFDIADEAAQENVLTEIMACCTSGLSTIATGADEAPVGALLVRRDDFDWGLFNGEALHICYIPLAPDRRSGEVLSALVGDVQERKPPIYASVKSGDKLGLAQELKKLGFAHECTAENGWGEHFREY